MSSSSTTANGTSQPSVRKRRSMSRIIIDSVNSARNDPDHHLAHLHLGEQSPLDVDSFSPAEQTMTDIAERIAAASPAAEEDASPAASTDGGLRKRKAAKESKLGQSATVRKSMDEGPHKITASLWEDVVTMQWMKVPASSFKLASFVVLLWANWAFFTPNVPNPFAPFIFLSYRLPPEAGEDPSDVRYGKGLLDLCFLAFYVIVFSCFRQTTTLYIFRPFAKWWGIRKEVKLQRFMEQGYAILFFGLSSSLGLYVMSRQENWWYQTEHFWLKYPHWRMKPELKAYYLLQLSYWLQQAIVMILKLEKPRKDYNELIAHHFVTLWLVGWSYGINLTMIGTTVFCCMDIPDCFLALAKSINYMKLERTSIVAFLTFIILWTYFRIYLSADTLRSVWFEFDLIPEHAKFFRPSEGVWLTWWMKYQVFTPLFLLLLLNLFWYFLMWRILFRAVIKRSVRDEREDGEDEDD